MGRQICFFATHADFLPILTFIYDKGWFITDETGKILTQDDAADKIYKRCIGKEFDYLLYIAKETPRTIQYTHFKRVDTLTSETIELRCCKQCHDIISQKNRYEHGRFWFENSYYDKNENVVHKSNELTAFYNSLVRFVKKISLISENKGYYILPEAHKLYKQRIFIPASGIYDIPFD